VQLALLAFRRDDLGVAHHAGVPDVVSVRAVVDEHSHVDTYLGSGETDALGRIHGREHVPYELL